MTTPANIPIQIFQGSDFEDFLEYTEADEVTPIDLTGVLARMQIRQELDSEIVEAELTTENGGLSIAGPTGTIRRFIHHDDTTLFQFQMAVYDLELIWPNGRVMRFCEGTVSVSPEVTRG